MELTHTTHSRLKSKAKIIHYESSKVEFKNPQRLNVTLAQCCN